MNLSRGDYETVKGGGGGSLQRQSLGRVEEVDMLRMLELRFSCL